MLTPDEEVGAGVGVVLLEILVNLGSTLASTNDGNGVGGVAVSQGLGHGVLVRRRVNDAGVVLGERLGDLGLTTSGNNDVPRAASGRLTRDRVARSDNERVNGLAVDGRLLRDDLDDLLAVRGDVVEVAGAPLHVVLVLDTSGEESAEVGKVDQPAVLEQVVEESKVATRVAESSHVLEEGDLHPRAIEEHAGVPGELGLLLEEGNLGHMVDLTILDGVVESHGNGEGGRAHANADEIVEFVLGRGLEVGSVLVHLGLDGAVDAAKRLVVVLRRGSLVRGASSRDGGVGVRAHCEGNLSAIPWEIRIGVGVVTDERSGKINCRYEH